MLTVPQEFHDYSRAPERRTDLIVRLDPLSWMRSVESSRCPESTSAAINP